MMAVKPDRNCETLDLYQMQADMQAWKRLRESGAHADRMLLERRGHLNRMTA